MNKTEEQIYNEIINHVNLEEFSIPYNQPADSYFPEFVAARLNQYIEYYKNNLKEFVDDQVQFPLPQMNAVLNKIEIISKAITKSLDLYYKGSINESYTKLKSGLEEINFRDNKTIEKINIDSTFFRARNSYNSIQYKRRDLFHIPFELRHFVSTNRYSLPGFPALYLGDSTYVCWEEYNRYRLRDLSFSKFKNTEELSVCKIQRIEDLLYNLTNNSSLQYSQKLTYILRFISTFPISLACSIRVLNKDGAFKPEYIIPQLLLKYIMEFTEMDGIMYPSSKINYSKIKKVHAYNYIFPIRVSQKSGFCPTLSKKFKLSEPSSIELEELIYNSPQAIITNGIADPDKTIEIISGVKSIYELTSFGKIEANLSQRNVDSVNA